MRTDALTISLVIAALGAGPVHAQAVAGQPIARVDVSLSTGAFSTATEQLNVLALERTPYNPWVHMALVDASVGYYWTDHLKTEIAAAWTTDGETSGSRVIVLQGLHTGWVYHTSHYTARQVGVGQLWQFGRNAMFHPWLGAGIDVVRIEHELDRPAQFAYVIPSGGQPSQSFSVPRSLLTSTTTRALPFASAGFKAYFNERAFVRSDLKLQIRNSVEHVVWKIGIGVDF
jgi:hypothetical protein